jgi:2-methylisocitrate lyase-like PEP mutase family enzyme
VAGLLGGPRDQRPTLRELIDGGEMVLAPGCYDALGARLVEEAGFPAAYMTGFGSAASRLGRPDLGLMTLSEMVDNARRIAQAIEVPVIADAGADVLFVEAPQSTDEIETVARSLSGMPLLFNYAEGGRHRR